MINQFEYGFDWKHQKNELFEREEVDDVSVFLASIKELRISGFYFRGVSNSKRKLVSSIQRAWHNGGCWRCKSPKSTFTTFMTGLLEFARKSDVFDFCPTRILPDHEVWAYLQHYICPTPFIDFSENPFVGLFFATGHAAEKDGFCSLYCIQPSGYLDGKHQDMMDLDTFITNEIRREEALTGFKSDACPVSLRDVARFKAWGFFQENETMKGKSDPYPLSLPENGVAFFVSKTGNGWCPKITEGRVNLQDGLFVYAPIEDIALEDFVAEKNAKVKPDGTSEDLFYPKLKCYDIPAKLIRELKEIVKGEGISDEKLGLLPCLEENKIKTMYGEYLKSLITTVTTK